MDVLSFDDRDFTQCCLRNVRLLLSLSTLWYVAGLPFVRNLQKLLQNSGVVQKLIPLVYTASHIGQ